MQDIQAIGGAATVAAGGGGGRSLFVAGSGDRRLRPHTHSSQNTQAVKCPRCDSSNTKFCYYNNYNLSQPRHFCKNCRRYWTKGGVLRNVPVGGGCRKAKRTKPKQTEDTPVANNAELDSNSNSSSESSSLTATNASVKMSTEVASATEKSSNSPNNLLNFPQSSRFFLDQHQPSIFPETGSFMSLMTPPPPGDTSSLLGFTFTDVSAYRMQQNQTCSSLVEDHHSSNHTIATRGDEEFKMEQINYGYLDPTANIGFTTLQQSRVAMGGLAGLDWQINGEDGGGKEADQDQGLFDFVEADQAYLSQNHWLDNDTSFNFPPLV